MGIGGPASAPAAKRYVLLKEQMDQGGRRSTAFKRIALSGLVLPYIVVLSLILAFKSIEGHSGYTTSSKEQESFETIVRYSTWITLALSVVLFLPYGINVVREKTRHCADPTERVFKISKLLLAYMAVLLGNGAIVVFVRSVAEVVVQSAK